MKRFGHAYDSQGTVGESEDGKYVLYEDVEPIISDRDIKAANLKLLVEKVLAIEVNGSDNFDPYTVMDAMKLARGLKQ